MYLLCVSLIVLVSVLMCLIVLIQNSKGGGLAAGFESSNQIMGVRRTTDFVEKATWTLASIICVLAIASAFVMDDMNQSSEATLKSIDYAPNAPVEAQGQYTTDAPEAQVVVEDSVK